ncbi:hypothetical protein RBS60_11035 [Sinomonas sp. ASV486]|nr:hypothetical protein [Sinomonas sp. ASV486]
MSRLRAHLVQGTVADVAAEAYRHGVSFADLVAWLEATGPRIPRRT